MKPRLEVVTEDNLEFFESEERRLRSVARQAFRDRHHILFPRVEWTARDQAKKLRNMHLYDMDRDIHNELHRNCPPVPILGYYALNNVLSEYHQGSTPLASFDNLITSIEIAAKHRKAHPIERELAYLALEALEMQKPFIFTPDTVHQ